MRGGGHAGNGEAQDDAGKEQSAAADDECGQYFRGVTPVRAECYGQCAAGKGGRGEEAGNGHEATSGTAGHKAGRHRDEEQHVRREHVRTLQSGGGNAARDDQDVQHHEQPLQCGRCAAPAQDQAEDGKDQQRSSAHGVDAGNVRIVYCCTGQAEQGQSQDQSHEG